MYVGSRIVKLASQVMMGDWIPRLFVAVSFAVKTLFAVEVPWHLGIEGRCYEGSKHKPCIPKM